MALIVQEEQEEPIRLHGYLHLLVHYLARSLLYGSGIVVAPN